ASGRSTKPLPASGGKGSGTALGMSGDSARDSPGEQASGLRQRSQMTPDRSLIESPDYAGGVAGYLGLLRELAAVEPPLFVFGSVAEAVLLDDELSKTHGDVDVAIPRTELGLRLRQLAVLGFDAFNVYYEPRPGLPLVYGSARGDLVLELSLVDFDP